MENVFLFVPNVIGYARIILAAIAFCLMRSLPGAAFSLYLLSCCLDAFDGFAARMFNQGTRFGAMLDMLTDRCATACLIVNLALLYPSATPLFQLSLSLDVAGHWLHLHSSVLKGSESHKTLGVKSSRLLEMYYTSRPLLFLMCAGNELFYSCLFLNYHYSGPIVPGLRMGLLPLLVVVFAPVAVLKAVITLMQLLAASADIAEVDRLERERMVKRK
uniref:CDP-diacylglycerol--inositol 3-phosphatidyltransferase isoform X2 n=1 Tax=Myxine glutinosa TaxID=7769 RepID=UPI00358EC774